MTYDYTVEVRNRFKGLDLTDRVPDELWNEVHDTTGDRDQDHPHGKERQKMKGKIYPFERRVPKKSKER